MLKKFKKTIITLSKKQKVKKLRKALKKKPLEQKKGVLAIIAKNMHRGSKKKKIKKRLAWL